MAEDNFNLINDIVVFDPNKKSIDNFIRILRTYGYKSVLKKLMEVFQNYKKWSSKRPLLIFSFNSSNHF